MKRSSSRFFAAFLAAILALSGTVAGVAQQPENPVIQIGLAFDSSACETAQLTNIVGHGFQFGVADAQGAFTVLAATDETTVILQKSQGENASKFAVDAVSAASGAVLFHFDEGSERLLTVRPVAESGVSAVSQCRFGGKNDYQYQGDFRFERIGGGNLTVVNLIALEDYIKGIVPYEMSTSWPIEALKAQSVCARTYTMCNLGRHKQYHFDLCATTDCQAYYGIGEATETTNAAVEQTRGQYAWYDGALAKTFYFSCDGGATEDVKNVWVSDYPYLKGKVDPYEPVVMQKSPLYGWTYTFTKEELRQKVIARGYTNCGEIKNLYVAKTTPLGNVYTITFEDVNGATYSFSKDNARTILGVKSLRFQISGSAIGGSSYPVNGTGTIPTLEGAYAIDGTGAVVPIQGAAYSISAGGTAPLAPTIQTVPSTYTVTGDGWGHHVGMSQWGAYAMALQGLTYQDILNFYFTGIEIR
ncbi:MAG: SpoIID/LytB domain-containing protein [Oscillospiraceae bacterium]